MPNRSQEKSDWLGRLKTTVEIIAIVVGGIWTGYEFLYQRTVERLEGRKLSWATLSLQTNAVKIDAKRYWVMLKLRAKNDSRRPVTPLLVSWWVKKPPDNGRVDPKPYKMWNEAEHLSELRPGQATEFSSPVIVEGLPSAVFVRAEVYFVQVREGETCILDPSQAHPEAMKSQPNVCIRDEKSAVPKCAQPREDCLYEYVEVLQPLAPLSKEGGS